MIEPGPGAFEPPDALGALLRIRTLAAGSMLHRIHAQQFSPVQFNPGSTSNARFSPIRNEHDALIPTLYAGSNFDCAAMETVFHDVPFVPGLKTLDASHLTALVQSVLTPRRALRLVDLSSTALRRLGTERRLLIDTSKADYPRTRRWAQALHQAAPDADGLGWVSRQDDRSEAIVLFGDRIEAAALDMVQAPRALVVGGQIDASLLMLAERIGVRFVNGRSDG